MHSSQFVVNDSVISGPMYVVWLSTVNNSQPLFERDFPTSNFPTRHIHFMATDNSSTMRLRSQDGPLTFTLKARNKDIRLSATHITSTREETQHDLSKRIATIASLPLNRLRVTCETSNRVLDKRIHQDSPPKVKDIPDEGTVLIIKDLGRTTEGTPC